MVYCLSVRIVTDSQVVIDTIKAKVKARTANELWQGDTSWKKKTSIDTNDHLVLEGEMRFLAEADMNTALDWMKNKAATYKPLLIGTVGESPDESLGSFVEAHTCDHRAGSGGCTVTYRWDK